MVDDSIVRGTTCANIVDAEKGRSNGSACKDQFTTVPHPCYFGTDVPSNEQLIAHSHTPEQIRDMIGADSLGYMEIEKLKNMVGDLHFCDACFTGNYPMEAPKDDIRVESFDKEIDLGEKNKRREYEYRQICKSSFRTLCQQRNAVYFFPGYEVPHMEKTLDRTCGD